MNNRTPKDGAESGGAVEIAYRHIRSAIVTGELKSGEALQEAKLADQIGVSRTPVREALQRLSNEGLVVLERYRRGQVANFSMSEVAEVFRLRAKLEGHGARRAARRITPSQIDHLEELEREMESIFAKLGWHGHLSQFDHLNNEFHATIASAADSPRLDRILASALELPPSIFNFYREPLEDRTRRTHRQHREIIDALKAGNPDWAEAAMNAHLLSILTDPNPEPE
ncbi:GntR family transcriptional regulator [Hoeflea sp. WL0058]|uniref:GntR family transcriptional regulator n=1 Tax=Flavimaribacter sediminis TaxID=2865987 RepID=A0AAE2ZNS1_9HYPH|nr:GntR family transcriptional regulator [Flavimaribacter sediminis]MBW8636737.1 GntR family transcriptional regulator [Flavimaribacter sediminis]